jgi:hypothetical protein
MTTGRLGLASPLPAAPGAWRRGLPALLALVLLVGLEASVSGAPLTRVSAVEPSARAERSGPAELSGRDVILKMQTARLRGSEDASSVFRVELRSRRGDEMTRTVAAYQRQCGDESKNLIVFREPADVAGSALLSSSAPDRVPDMWLYLPELGRVRQLNPMTQSEYFMGSDFTYEDLGRVVVDAREYRLLVEADLDGEPVYKVQSIPNASESYGKIVTWVSRETFLPVRIEYYDELGALLKTARFGNVRRIKDIPTPFSIEMENAETGHVTRLTLLEADYYRGLECELFSRLRPTMSAP